jgi:hypothetical protein
VRVRRPASVFALIATLAWAAPVSGQPAADSDVPVTGVVLDLPTGAVLPAASIALYRSDDDRASRESLTDDDGRFHLEPVPPGSYRIEVSALGYRTVRESLEIRAHGPLDVQIEIVPEALELEPVVVTVTSSRWLGRTGFFDRRTRAVGTFFTRMEILRNATTSLLSDVFRMVPGARVVPPAEFGQTARVEFRGGCEPALFVDGNPMISGTSVDDVLQAHDVEGMEVYRGITVPPQFSGRGSCGAIVVWTREPGRGDGSVALFPTLGRALLGLGAVITAVFISF